MSAVSAPTPETVSIREFARRDRCDESRVRRAIRSGHLKRSPDGKLDAALVGTGWRETNRRNASRADPADKTLRTPTNVRSPAAATIRIEPYVPHHEDYRPANYPEGMAAMAVAAGYEVALSLGGRLPHSVVDAIAEEVAAAVRHQGVMMLDEELVSPPPGYSSWAMHPLFTDPIDLPSPGETRAESQADADAFRAKSAELATASIQAGGAAPDA